MSKQVRPLFGWVLVGTGSIGALVISIEAATLPFLHSAGLAQADFELFIASVVVGVPAVLLSIAGAFVLRGPQARKSPRPHLSTAVTVINTVVAISSGAFALLIRSYGFFWQ